MNMVQINDIILTERTPRLEVRKEISTIERLKLFLKAQLTIFWEGIRLLQSISIRNGLNKVGIPNLIIAQQCFG